MKKIGIILLFSFYLQAQNQFQINIDAARFKGDNEKAFVEFYFSFDVSKLKYLKSENGFSSEAFVSFTSKRTSDDSLVIVDEWKVPFIFSDTSVINLSRIYTDVVQVYLKDDVYRIYFKIVDVNNFSNSDSITFIYNSNIISDDKVSISELELCSSISPSEKKENNQFYKNTFEAKPNPSKIYGTHQPVLFYYSELYNLDKTNTSQLKIKSTIVNSFGKEVQSQEKIRKNNYSSFVEVGLFKVNNLKTGAYQLNLEISDSSANVLSSTAKKFFIFNQTLSLVDSSFSMYKALANEYATFTAEEILREFEIIKYIASKLEVDQFKKLSSLDAKRNFLVEFWVKKNKFYESETNDYKNDFFMKVEKANNLYKSGFKEGWKSDRGRVLIVYGEPDEIERHNNEVDVKPYEVWHYNSIQGGTKFYFGDRTGFSDYQLLHSNHRDELHDEGWMKYLQSQ